MYSSSGVFGHPLQAAASQALSAAQAQQAALSSALAQAQAALAAAQAAAAGAQSDERAAADALSRARHEQAGLRKELQAAKQQAEEVGGLPACFHCCTAARGMPVVQDMLVGVDDCPQQAAAPLFAPLGAHTRKLLAPCSLQAAAVAATARAAELDLSSRLAASSAGAVELRQALEQARAAVQEVGVVVTRSQYNSYSVSPELVAGLQDCWP